ncbi:MAG: fasciclin domain-containing protein [Deltaproteobacteria bacterium]|nr:MAG: fasciclin domain-containing protein [Deltaproteobacteria bacterium]
MINLTNRLLLTALLALSGAVLAACGDDEDPATTATPDPSSPSSGNGTDIPSGELGNIAEVATEAGNFTILLQAVEAAGLADALAGTDDLTVFAPTDAAFEAAITALGTTADDLLADTELLGTVLTYHVVAGTVLSTDLETGPASTLGGLSLWVNLLPEGVRINNAAVTAADVRASNGVIHVIDAVMLPANIVDMATYAGLNTLVSAVDAANLGGTLADPTNSLTVFAPSDEAFDAALTALGLTADALFADEELLGNILGYHVFPAAALSSELSDGQVLEMFNGEDATVDLTALTVGGARLGVLDIVVTNGVIHTLDDVMVPPSLED